MQTKSGQDLIDLIVLAYKANQPVLLEGPHGIGKSEQIEQAATQLGIDFMVRDLSLMEPPDLIGLPTQKDGKTVYALPSFLPMKGKGLIAFEELNRSEKYMMAPCLQLLTARCLNDYRLPAGWLPVAAINPAEDGYNVNELDPALLSRFLRIQVSADCKSWLAWAQKNNVHASVLRYVGAVADIFESSNPRSWVYVSNALQAYERCKPGNRQILMAAIAGLVDDTHAKAFLNMYKSGDTTITVTAVLQKYRCVRSTVLQWKQAHQTDQLQATAHAVLIALQDSDVCAEISGSKTMIKNLRDFIGDLPADLGRKIKTAAENGGALE